MYTETEKENALARGEELLAGSRSQGAKRMRISDHTHLLTHIHVSPLRGGEGGLAM